MEHPNNGTGDSRQTLMELILGTVLWGIVICLVGIWFASDRVVWLFSMGAGVSGAVAMAAHMYRSIEYAMEMPGDSAGKYLRKQSLLRMGGAMVLALGAYYLKGNVVAIFLGLLASKPGAYVQPLLHRVLGNLKKGR